MMLSVSYFNRTITSFFFFFNFVEIIFLKAVDMSGQPSGAHLSSSTCESPAASVSPSAIRSAPRRRLTKRVYFLTVCCIALLWYAVFAEGIGGLLTMAIGFVCLRLLWWIARVLVLNRVPFFHTLSNVLLKWTTTDDRPPSKAKRVVFQ